MTTTAAAEGKIMADYQTVTLGELVPIIVTALMTPMRGDPNDDNNVVWGLTLNIEGEPGVGKTSIINAIGESIGIRTVSLRAAPHPPEDFSGALIPDGQGGAKQICSIGVLRELLSNERGLVFLDEINGGAPATQGAIQALIGERLIGEDPIGGGIRLIAASNPEDIATGGYRFAPAFANRLVHIHEQISVDEWVEWNLYKKNVSLPSLLELEDAVKADWAYEFTKTRGLFSSFIQKNPGLLLKRPDIHNPQSGKAWPSPRTWDYAQRIWATSNILKKNFTEPDSPEAIFSNNSRDLLVEGCVGPGAAKELLKYAATADLPDPNDVLDGKWQFPDDRLDITLIACSSAISYAIEKSKSKNEDSTKLVLGAWSVLETLLNKNLTDMVVVRAMALAKANLGLKHNNEEVREKAKKVLVEISKHGAHKYLGI